MACDAISSPRPVEPPKDLSAPTRSPVAGEGRCRRGYHDKALVARVGDCGPDGDGVAARAGSGGCARRPFARPHARHRHAEGRCPARTRSNAVGSCGARNHGAGLRRQVRLDDARSPPAAPAPTPASQIGAPAAQLQALAPLSPPVTPTTLTAGGAARTNSPSASSTSPTEAASGLAGGGGKSLEDCMGFWDRGTHMTKAEWRASCARSLNRLANLKPETLGLAPPKNGR